MERLVPVLLFALALGAMARADGGEAFVRVEPEVEVVPANHLKFYLYFQEPMERGDVFQYLRLVEVDGAGRTVSEVPEPFREVELWDASFTRMTLWFHPGRQKPGVNLNVEIGPILEEGRHYRLEISPEWKTEKGAEMGKVSGRRWGVEFKAGPVDDTQPNPASWKVKRHVGGITVTTGESLDPASVEKRVTFFGPSGSRAGDLRFSVFEGYFLVDGGTWDAGEYRMQIDPELEDLAGNSIERPFNLDVREHPDFQERTEPVVVEFSLP